MHPNSDQSEHPVASPENIGPDDPRYNELVRRQFNKRFKGHPDYIRLAGSTQEIIDAVQEAIDNKLRLVVQSGGHCLEGFVSDPAVKVRIDTSLMTAVYYDKEMDAIAIEAGTKLGEVFRKLFLGWGVMLPAGESPEVGIGGHVLGGAFGFFCREHGLAADHLYAVEVVVVDEAGIAKSIVATREVSDPSHDLWWAHTGGGGGNFGIVTRYWFRTTGAVTGNPRSMLPKAPETITTIRVSWNWVEFDEASFSKLLHNFLRWCEQNSGADSEFAKLSSMLSLKRKQAGAINLLGVTTAGSDAERLFDRHLEAINDEVGIPFTRQVEKSSWLGFALDPFPEIFRFGLMDILFKGKDAFLRKCLTDAQISLAWGYLTTEDYDVMGGSLNVVTYGGKVNTLAPAATASAHRECAMLMSLAVGWGRPEDEAMSLAWLRSFYAALFAATGGVPVPGEITDGSMINHPDIDLADPTMNTSGVPWHTLYYKDNYPRLQMVKAAWDPMNIFQHALSIKAG